MLGVELFEDEGIGLVTVPDHQLSLAIGREGQNVRLAARLTGWRLDITSDSEAAEARARYLAEREAEPLDEDGVAEAVLAEDAVEPEEGEAVALTIDEELLRKLEEFKRERFENEYGNADPDLRGVPDASRAAVAAAIRPPQRPLVGGRRQADHGRGVYLCSATVRDRRRQEQTSSGPRSVCDHALLTSGQTHERLRESAEAFCASAELR